MVLLSICEIYYPACNILPSIRKHIEILQHLNVKSHSLSQKTDCFVNNTTTLYLYNSMSPNHQDIVNVHEFSNTLNLAILVFLFFSPAKVSMH